MPTLRPRIQVTETEELTRALAIAEEMWPGESKSTQVCRLAALGAESAIEARTQRMIEIQEVQAYIRANVGNAYEGVTKADLRRMWDRDAS